MRLFASKHDLHSLVARCKVQDEHAWSEVVERFSDLVYSVAKRHRLSSEDASDVFQNTFQTLHAKLADIENPEALPKWLAVTASRFSLRVIRNSGNTLPFEIEGLDLNEVIAAEDESAEDSAMKACESQIVREAVAELGGRCTPLLQLLYLSEDVSYQEVSDQLGIPVGAIGPTRSRCLEKLQKVLSDKNFFD